MKSKEEIIREVAGAYTLNTRAIGSKGCAYETEDGKHCAVGRYLIPESIQQLKDSDNMGCRVSYISCFLNPETYNQCADDNIDPYLQEEYRGHCVTFWSALQHLHDRKEHWNEHGLSLLGQEYMERLLIQWKNR